MKTPGFPTTRRSDSSFSRLPRFACVVALSACVFGHARADDQLQTQLDDSTGYDNTQSSATASSLSDSSSGSNLSESLSCSYGGLRATSSENVPPNSGQTYATLILSSVDEYTIHLANGSTGVARFFFHLGGSLTGVSEGDGDFSCSYEARAASNASGDEFYGTGALGTMGMTGSQPSDVGSGSIDISFTTDSPFGVSQSLSCGGSAACLGPSGDGRFATDVTLSSGGFTVVDTDGNPADFTAESHSGSARGSNVPAGGAFAGFSLTNNAPGQLGTIVELLDGTASAAVQVTAAFTGPPPTSTQLVSDAVDLGGTNTDPVVIQMHYDVALAQSVFGTLANLGLAYFRPSDGAWVSAVLGNTGATEATYFNRAYNPATDFHLGYVGNDTVNGVVWAVVNYSTKFAVTSLPQVHPPFFTGEAALGSGVYYLQFPNGNPFGYYGFLADPNYIYHLDLGYEYVFDAKDAYNGVYLYDFTSNTFFYTSPSFPFPYLYDFSLNSTLYYYPDPNNPGRYNTNGVRYFYRFDTGQIFTK